MAYTLLKTEELKLQHFQSMYNSCDPGPHPLVSLQLSLPCICHKVKLHDNHLFPGKHAVYTCTLQSATPETLQDQSRPVHQEIYTEYQHLKN